MHKIDKSTVPDFFIKSSKAVKFPLTASAWSDLAIHKIRADLREYILLEEQSLLCCYCEQEIDSDQIILILITLKKEDYFLN